MQKSVLFLVALSAIFCGASATQAANWVPLDTVAEDAPLVRTNHDESEDGSNSAVLCTSVPVQGAIGIEGGGRRLGFLLPNGKCKTVGRKNQVKEIGEGIMVLLDDHHVPGSTYEPGKEGEHHDDGGPGGPNLADLTLLADCIDGAPTGSTLERLTNCAATMFPDAAGHGPNGDTEGVPGTP